MIILPKLRIPQMSNRSNRNISRSTVREMMNWGHGAMRNKIIYKAQLKGKIVLDVDESYTTRTCCGCGIINEYPSSKRYHCNHCGLVCHSDVNGAVNIFMKSTYEQINNKIQ